VIRLHTQPALFLRLQHNGFTLYQLLLHVYDTLEHSPRNAQACSSCPKARVSMSKVDYGLVYSTMHSYYRIRDIVEFYAHFTQSYQLPRNTSKLDFREENFLLQLHSRRIFDNGEHSFICMTEGYLKSMFRCSR